MAPRYFTLAEAQALLPRVRTLLGQALQLHAFLRRDLAELNAAGHEVGWATLRGDETLALGDERSRRKLIRARGIYAALREQVEDLEGLGVEVKSVTGGLVDFRSWCEGEREVLLCYRLGESEINQFHGIDDGFAGRESVAGHAFMSAPSVRKEDPSRPRDPLNHSPSSQ